MMLTSGCLVVWALALSGSAHQPAFSWDTVPVFQQLCNVNGTLAAEFPRAKLAWLARYFPLVTLEHCQGQGFETYTGQILQHGFIEDHMLAAAAQLKAVNSSVTVLYYNNQDAALPYYRQSRPLYGTHPEWALKNHPSHDEGGHMFPNLTGVDYNLSIPEVQQLWKSHFSNMTKPGSPLDGIFIDVAGALNSPLAPLFGELQQSNPSTIVGHVSALNARVPYKLKQVYTFGADPRSIQSLQDCASQGSICQAHWQPSFESFGGQPHATPTGFNATLAASCLAQASARTSPSLPKPRSLESIFVVDLTRPGQPGWGGAKTFCGRWDRRTGRPRWWPATPAPCSRGRLEATQHASRCNLQRAHCRTRSRIRRIVCAAARSDGLMAT
jgi:hypothetical protein